jgi:uncharacterized protein YbjT (DUF2867 family)
MFAGNTLWWWGRSIRAGGVVRLPYPDVWTAPVHEKDLAALAVTALTEPGHHGRAYPVRGPELTVADQVRHIGTALRREIPVEVVTGKPARTFAQWAEDHAVDFR